MQLHSQPRCCSLGTRKQRVVRVGYRPNNHAASSVTQTTTDSTSKQQQQQAGAASAAAQLLQQQQHQQQLADPRVSQATVDLVRSLWLTQATEEHDYVLPADWIEGTLPPGLVGTYLRNGPGRSPEGAHVFDGDGHVLAFSFDGAGRVRFTNRFVRTRGFLDEQAAGRPVHRTAFTRGAADGSLFFNPFDLRLKNVANTGVVMWGGRLLALYESNLPHELDPGTLGTFGETDLGGQLQTPALAAHYRIMPPAAAAGAAAAGAGAAASQQAVGSSDGGRTLVGFSFASKGLAGGELLFYEFAESGGGRLRGPPTRHSLPGVPMALIHDLAVTPDYYVIAVCPTPVSPARFIAYMASRCSIAECMTYDPSQPTQLHLVPRPGGAAAGTRPYVIDAPPMFAFHHVNAWQATVHDTGDTASPPVGQSSSSTTTSSKRVLVLDTVAWDDMRFDVSAHNLTREYYTGGVRPTLRRLTFELAPPLPAAAAAGRGSASSRNSSGSSTGRCIGSHRLLRRTAEFPCVNPAAHGRPQAHVYAAVDAVDDELHWGPSQALAKISWPDQQQQPSLADIVRPTPTTQLWHTGSRRLVGEPMFVPRQPGTAVAAAEDDGWVLAVVHNAATECGELVVLDAQRFSEGPVATVRLPHALPPGLHGSFSPELLLQGDWDALAARQAWRHPRVVPPF